MSLFWPIVLGVLTFAALGATALTMLVTSHVFDRGLDDCELCETRSAVTLEGEVGVCRSCQSSYFQM